VCVVARVEEGCVSVYPIHAYRYSCAFFSHSHSHSLTHTHINTAHTHTHPHHAESHYTAGLSFADTGAGEGRFESTY
jgi:hypothetical protein